MTLVGLVSMIQLPIAQYPNIVPPEIQVRANYTGADAQTIEQSVAAPIEQQLSGVDKSNYIQSVNANGSIRMTVNFDTATDPNVDHILTQMRVNQAQSQLPQDVVNAGVTVQKSTTAPLMLVALNSPKGTYDNIFLANYANINLIGEIVLRANPDGSLLRLKEVARIELGAQVYTLSGRLDGKPSAILACYQLPG